MADVEGFFRRVFAVVAGSLVYVGLVWVPFIGPLAVGFFVGYWVGGGFGSGFRHGLWAAGLGVVLTAYLLHSYVFMYSSDAGLMIILLAWVMLVWNCVGVFLAGLGAGVGAVSRDVYSMVPIGIQKMFTVRRGGSSVDYVICPVCGQGNVASADTCVSCGGKIK